MILITITTANKIATTDETTLFLLRLLKLNKPHTSFLKGITYENIICPGSHYIRLGNSS